MHSSEFLPNKRPSITVAALRSPGRPRLLERGFLGSAFSIIVAAAALFRNGEPIFRLGDRTPVAGSAESFGGEEALGSPLSVVFLSPRGSGSRKIPCLGSQTGRVTADFPLRRVLGEDFIWSADS